MFKQNLSGQARFEGLKNWLFSFFYLDHLILHLELHCSNFAMWRAAVLIEWLSPSHYLYTTATAPSILRLVSIGITYKLVPILGTIASHSVRYRKRHMSPGLSHV